MEKRSRSVGKSIDERERETMEKRRRSVETWNYLPPEVVEEEILWRLPVKSIIRCGSVCKSWYSLIRSRIFISTHLLNHKTRIRNPPLVFVRDFDEDRFKDAQFSCIFENHNHPFDDVHHLDRRVIRLPTDPVFRFYTLGHSCNGVFSLVDILRSTFILCNPSINRALLLPMPQLVPLSKPTFLPNQLFAPLLGFGFHDADYSIVRIVRSSSTIEWKWAAELYSLNSNSWRPILVHGIPKFDPIDNNYMAAFVNGRLHWIVRHDNHTSTSHFILVFDLNHHTFHHISFPKCLAGFDAEKLRLRAFQESSIVLVQFDPYQRVTPTWILEAYGAEEESWKTTKMDLLDSRILGSTITNDHNFLKVVQRFGASPLPYMPSLVLLDKQNS